MKIQVHTLAFGTPDWLLECRPTLEAWCQRHDMELVSWGDPEVWKDYPSPKFCEIDMLRHFLASDAQQLVYVDADVLVHPFAPKPSFGPGFHMMPDRVGKWSKEWPGWCNRHFGRLPINWTYRNAGVWVCDRNAARQLLARCRPPYVARWQDQHQWNFWLWEATKVKGDKLQIVNLPSEWNCFPENVRHAWFMHASGHPKDKFLAAFKERMNLPDPPERFVESTQPSREPFGIVWPYHSGKAQGDELLYSIGSLRKNFNVGKLPLVVCADEMTPTLQGLFDQHLIHGIEITPSYVDALTAGLQMFDKVLWMNDDIVFTSKVELDDYKIARHYGEVTENLAKSWLQSRNPWTQGRGRAWLSLRAHGHKKIYDCEGHIPYLFERSKVVETLKRHGIWHKMPLQTLYAHDHGLRMEPMGNFKGSQLRQRGTKVFNWSAKYFTSDLRGQLDSWLLESPASV